jgi:signal peptidase II
MRARDIGLVTAAVALILDQGTKLLILYGLGLVHLGSGQSMSVLPFFNLTMVQNAGISFGLFPASGPEGTAILATFQLLAAGGLAWWLCFVHRPVLAISLGLLIGGALGNLIDRLVYGWVNDFFDFHLLGYHWYVFNVADAAITFGVIGLLYDALMKPETPQGEAGKE